jgi:hypothetical protein
MTFRELDKNKVIKEAQDLFLNQIPLREIDNKDVVLICHSYRNNNSSVDSCRHLFKKHSEYFYNWAYNNWMVDVFYFQR